MRALSRSTSTDRSARAAIGPGLASFLIALLTAVWAAPAQVAPASAPAPGGDPQRDAAVAERIVEAFNEPEAAKRVAKLEALLGPGERTQRIATALSFLARRHGRVAVEEIAESGPTWAAVVLRGDAEEDFLTLEIEYEANESQAIRSLGFRAGRAAPSEPTRLDAATLRELVDAIAALVRAEYAIASERDRLGDAIERWDTNLFADATGAPQLATRLTAELRRLQDDKHFAVLDPDRAAGRIESPGEPSGHGHGHGPELAGRPEATRAEVLEGNVGYLEVRAFDGSNDALGTLHEAMASLQTVEALIVDLRDCPGGEPAMVVALSSYFFSEPTHLATSVSPWAEGPQERWTHAPPIGHFTSLPVLVLTSGMTASAAESFLFGLERHDRVTAVGETTAGAGHLADVRRLPAGFALQLPVGRTYDPETGEGWEGVGIRPDVPAAADDALEVALSTIRDESRR